MATSFSVIILIVLKGFGQRNFLLLASAACAARLLSAVAVRDRPCSDFCSLRYRHHSRTVIFQPWGGTLPFPTTLRPVSETVRAYGTRNSPATMTRNQKIDLHP